MADVICPYCCGLPRRPGVKGFYNGHGVIDACDVCSGAGILSAEDAAAHTLKNLGKESPYSHMLEDVHRLHRGAKPQQAIRRQWQRKKRLDG